MQTIVFLDRDTLAPSVKLREPGFAHRVFEHGKTSPEQVLERLKGATIAIVNKVKLDAKTLEACPELRLVAVAATGTDCVDVQACARLGITVTNIRGYAVNTVPEHTMALMLALRRSIVAYRQDVVAGAWQKAAQFCFFDHRIEDLSGARLGVVGEGVLGQRVAALARAFGMEVIFAGHKGKPLIEGLTPWDEFLATSDVITLHCPLTADTHQLFGAAEFGAMERKPIFINTARGGLVDELALEAAIASGDVAGAGIDVTTKEPPELDSVIMRLAAKPNVIVTPHVAWASEQAQQTLADQLIDLIEAAVTGTPRNVVSPS